MLSAQFLDKMSAIMAAVRRTEPSRAWGGVQIVYSGDFAQLRPVYRRQEMGERPLLAFRAEVAWVGAAVQVHQLRTAHRQSRDARYAELLERARFGRLRPADVALLRTRVLDASQGVPESMRGAMLLFSTNRRVDDHNRRCMARLDEKTSHTYRASIACHAKDAVRKEIMSRPRTTDVRKRRLLADKGADGRKWMRENMRAVPSLELRKNARVMLLANVDQQIGLANGCLGTVVGFDDEGVGQLPVVRFDRSGIETVVEPYEWKFDQHPGWAGSYSQVPLMLAYACTIHKSQGLTVDRVIADLSADDIRDAGYATTIHYHLRLTHD